MDSAGGVGLNKMRTRMAPPPSMLYDWNFSNVRKDDPIMEAS
jgi:hypothetical protein